MMAGHMGKLQAACNITDSIDFPVRCSEASVHGDALGRIIDPRRFQVQVRQIGLASRRHQYMAAPDQIAAVQGHGHAARRRRDAFSRDAGADINAFPGQAILYHGRQLRIIVRQQPGHFDNGDGGAQAPVGLGQFHADGAAADDNQVGHILGVIEHCLVGQIGHVLQARNGRHQG